MAMALGIVLAAAILAVSLGLWAAKKPKGPRYEICVGNRTRHRLDDVWVYYGTEIAAAPGGLVAGGRKTYAIVTLPVPDEATITWVQENVRHSPKVKLVGVPRCPRDLNLWFIVNEDGSVEVAAVRYDDLGANVALAKTLLPYREGQ
jgi:hypothetical protein